MGSVEHTCTPATGAGRIERRWSPDEGDLEVRADGLPLPPAARERRRRHRWPDGPTWLVIATGAHRVRPVTGVSARSLRLV